MTVLDNTPRDQYTATGGQVAFSYTFEIAAEGDIAVLQNGVLLSLGAGAGEYAVTGVGSDTGGVVTLVTGATAGDIITLYRDMALERLTSYTNGGDFLAADVNNDYDRLWLALQQNTGTSNRALVAPNTDPTNINMTIPDKAARSGKFLSFDSVTSNPTVTSISDVFGSGTLKAYNFVGDGSTTAFTLGSDPGVENNTQVYIDGVYQQKNGYTVSGTTLTFSAAPPNLSTIEVMVIQPTAINTADAASVSFTQAGSNDTRTVQAKLEESVSVKDFGAVGDGVTDCSAAITAALAAVTAYGTLVFPAGTYIIDSPIVIPSSNITIDGQGARLLAKPSVSFEYMLSATSKSGVVIKNIEADANQLNRVGVQGVRFMAMAFTSCDDCTFENCIARNVLGYSSIPGVGLTIGGTSIRCQIVNCRLINCGSATQGADGVFMSGEANMVIGSTAINCFDTGFAVESSNASGIVGCITRSCGASAAITNAVNDDKYANFIDGLSAFDTTGGGGVTGLIQIGCPLSSSLGNLYDTSISNVILSNPTGGTGVGPAINIRQTGTPKAVRLSIDSVRVFNATTQGILIDGDNVSIRNSDIYGATAANFQFTDGSTGGYVSNCTTNGGSYGLITQGTASVTVNNCVFTSPTAWGLYAFDTSTLSSYFNQAISPATGPASKAAGATLKLVGGDVGLQLNNASGTAPAGALSDKIEVFDANNVSLGFMAIYAS